MPSYDLKGIKVAKYVNTSGAITYTDKTSIGDAMECNLELKFAEGRLYAEGSLAEYIKLAIGGSASIATKYIPNPAQILMFGCKENTRMVNETPVISLKHGAKNIGKDVGVAFYAPDKIDGEDKITCVFVSRAVFGAPAMKFQTLNGAINFQTPTTSGEFMPNHAADKDMFEVATVDDEATAIAWIDEVLK